MTRITPNQNPNSEAQAMLAQVKATLGSTPNIFTTMAHSPATFGFYLQGSAALGKSTLSAKLREQLALVVAGLNGCNYCASAHTVLGGMQKIAESELALNLKGQSADSKVQAALGFASAVVTKHGRVNDADFALVRSAGYTDGEIMDIIAVVGLNIFTNYFNEALGTVVDFPLVSTADVMKAA